MAISKCAKPVQSSSLAEPGLPNGSQGDDNDDDDDDDDLHDDDDDEGLEGKRSGGEGRGRSLSVSCLQ